MPPFAGGRIGTLAAPVDRVGPLLSGHRYQSLISPVAHHLALKPHSTSGQKRRIPCNHTPRRSDLPSRRRESGLPKTARNSLMIEPPKATKGRRMSKKSRKKSPQTAPKRALAAKSSKVSKTTPRKTRPSAVKPSTRKASIEASHMAASKRLKAPSPAKNPKPRNDTTSPMEKDRGLAEGAEAPAFHLPRDGGGLIALSDYVGKKLVLFFYPRADTPGCTREAIDFTRLKTAFAASGTEVLGISADSLGAQERFRDKHKLSVPLISDEKHQMLEAYGAWGEKSMYGRTFLGIRRTTVLIGADGRVVRVWRNVKVDGHADEVLATARALVTKKAPFAKN